MPIINIRLHYPNAMARLVERNTDDLAQDLRSRGIECSVQRFESEEELGHFLLNQADGPETDYEFPFSLGPK